MIVAEFLVIAFVVGILTATWLGFLATFLGLYTLYRFTRLSAVVSLAVSLYWGLVGFQLGAASGELGVGPLLAVAAFAVSAWVHRDGLAGLSRWWRPARRLVRAEASISAARDGLGALHVNAGAPIAPPTVHPEYRVLS